MSVSPINGNILEPEARLVPDIIKYQLDTLINIFQCEFDQRTGVVPEKRSVDLTGIHGQRQTRIWSVVPIEPV